MLLDSGIVGVLLLAVILSRSSVEAILAPSLTQIVVAPHGNDEPQCGSLTSPCRTIAHATRIAAPHSVINVGNGTYSCGIHVTVPLAIVALDTGVFLQCNGASRGIWFDGVPAQVEGVHFLNGYGEGAGCIVSSQHVEHPYMSSTITRCTFQGCTGIASPLFRGVGGAVLITYTFTRNPRPYSFLRSQFEQNYARGDSRPAGALSVRAVQDMHKMNPPRQCSKLVIDAADPEDPRTGRFGGVFYSLGPKYTVAGYETYNTLGRLPNINEGDVHWLAYCPDTSLYGFLTSQGEAGALNGCTCEVCGTTTMEKAAIYDYEWWRVKDGSRAILRPVCQDAANSPACDAFFVHNVPIAQSGRQGLFTRIPTLTIAERPVFAAFDGDDAHYVWYCEHLNEWIFTDEDPVEAIGVGPGECRRGITSVSTRALHPLAVESWKYWGNTTKTWHSASPKRSGGMTLVCQSRDELQCPVVELVNAPVEKSTTFVPLRAQSGAIAHIEQRPVLTSTAVPPRFLAYCQKFSEWMIVEDNPYLHPREARNCERTFSSLKSYVRNVDEAGSWAIGRGSDWEFSTVDVLCVAGCRRFVLSVAALPSTCTHCGDYEAAGRYENAPFYRQITAPYHIILRPRRQRWVILPGVNSTLETPEVLNIADLALLISDTDADDVLLTRKWSAPTVSEDTKGQLVYSMACASAHNCSLVSVMHDDFPTLSGEFLRTTRAVARRPTYASRTGAVMEYSEAHQAWVIAHPDSSTRLGTSPTHAVVPVSGVKWDRRLTGAGKWRMLDPRASVRCSGAATPRIAAGRAGDTVADCSFTANHALGEVNDTQPAAGGVMLYLGEASFGTVTRGVIKNITASRNEASSPFSSSNADGVGAVSVHADSPISHYVSIVESQFTANQGDVGGAIALDGTGASLSRVTMRNNYASVRGGGLAGYNSHINASQTGCSHNYARTSGGCAWMGYASRITLKNSDALNNTAGLSGGVVGSRGFVHVLQTKVDRMVGMAFTGAVLLLVESQLFCGMGRAMTFVGGFGCVHDPAPNLPAGTTTPIVPIDETEAFWIWLANGSSMLAQVMLSLTMVVFAIQFCMAHHLSSIMPTTRQLQASRWRATQQRQQETSAHQRRK
jgi:hypothetical protein